MIVVDCDAMIMRILFLFIPATVVAHWLASENFTLMFLLSAVAIVPASLYIESATDRIADFVGPTIGGLLNATFGNLPELFIGVATLKLAMYGLLKSQLIGGILVNILFVSGAAMLMGGLKYKTQSYNTVSARSYTSLMFLASVGLLLPSLYIAGHGDNRDELRVVELSLFISAALMITYFLYLFFSLKTHKGLIETPAIDVESKETSHQSLPVVVGILLAASLTAVWLSDVLVDAITPAAKSLGVNETFMGLIVLGLIGNASGIVTAIKAARKDRMDLAFNVSIGSSVQQILFVAPALVFLSFVFGPQPMDLAFTISTAAITFICVILMGILISDGQSHWLKGVQLLSLFAILVAVILTLT
jgi:Ca2+:H+ antiporter